MRTLRHLLLCSVLLSSLAPASPAQSSRPHSSPVDPVPRTPVARTIDGIAAKIENDVITESDVRELRAFQVLLNGSARPRDEVIRELIDQWVINNEAANSNFRSPPPDRVQAELDRLTHSFPASQAFQDRLAEVGLTPQAVSRLLERQIYLTRFLELRFRPATDVSEKEIEDYYRGEFSNQLKARKQDVPPLAGVRASIRELLTQRAINQRAGNWITEMKSRMQIEIQNAPGGP